VVEIGQAICEVTKTLTNPCRALQAERSMKEAGKRKALWALACLAVLEDEDWDRGGCGWGEIFVGSIRDHCAEP
jgi:hypothetical protein